MRNFLLGTIFSVTIGFAAFQLSTHEASAQSSPKMNLSDPLPANVFIELAKVINPTVVNISTSTNPRIRTRRYGHPQDPFQNMIEQFMGPQQRGPLRPQQALGTGFIIRADGLILTNNHVVEDADVIKVQLSENDNTSYTAELIGRDKRTDLALIKIDAKKKLPFATLGSSQSLQVGEWVAAFGNPLGLGHTTSKGIISAIGREIDELNRFPFVQTDASINPGNSGGPLVNLKGEVIGVNSAIAANGQGIGFAIPIDEAKTVIKVLEKEGVIKRGFLGINMYPYPINPQAAQEMGLTSTNGVLVVGVTPGSPAHKSGLKEYDFIIKFNKQDVDSSPTLSRLISDAEVGRTYDIEIIRSGKKSKVKVTLEEHPDDKQQANLKKKVYRGQKAPYDLGFTITNYTKDIAEEYGLAPLKRPYPVVIDIEDGSPAAKSGLGIGDIIVDVNRKDSPKDTDVLKLLKNKQINSLRVLRGQQPILIYMNPK
ncbi:MAG: trypsin-like peptidase domain-containing protein [Bdellovibrionales bacterium]|nr:trypsin-like peptidase domain-containing protein [Bdellovibrionales bacterium]